MKIWKIEHCGKSAEGVKIAVATSSHESRGIILKPREFVLSSQQLTASLDSQTRRGYVKVEEFDNTTLNLQLGTAYDKHVLDVKVPEISPEIVDKEAHSEEVISEPSLTKLQKAEKNASDYINNKEK
jgi:hypothetical protein